ncbi:hypothetical protein HMPREF1991_02515 [Hoylesella loescheii DSM 19665 = JCM 12249 = ATCC 15930]|uniref:Uncharacterized protein n=1 Tax=Hoylesella loescheii DSM 19665 = JCM 12249 = ATCC 15930 TaxID=1122985 RepID=A0A069QNK0_HOYLO|nr:hypothetical protein HMPREF1991_02515 [Hoylesella loescheii DSM 19665 = JCM 12249 = ATCC 15930]
MTDNLDNFPSRHFVNLLTGQLIDLFVRQRIILLLQKLRNSKAYELINPN